MPARAAQTRDRRPLLAVLTANVISVTGNWLSLIAIPVFVYATTGSVARTGVVAFWQGLPMVLSAVLGGPLIDRVGRRRVSVGTDLVSAVAVAAIPLLHQGGLLHFWMLCALVTVTGLCRSPGESARGVLLPHLAERAGTTVAKAASHFETARQLARLLGGPLAGVLIAVFSPSAVLFVDAVSFLASAVLVLGGLRGLPAAAPVADAPRVDLRTYREELRAGFAFLRRTRLLLAITLMVMVTNALNQGWSAVLLPAHATDNLGGSVSLGLITGVASVGAICGALLYGTVFGRFRRRTVYATAFLVAGAPRFVLAAVWHDPVPLAVLMLFSGLAAGVLNPLMGPLVFELVPEELRSRVQGVSTAGALAAIPLGTLGSGLLAQATGLTGAFWLVGGLYLLVTLCPLVFPVWRRMDAPAVPEKEVRPAVAPHPV
ncbi:MFS transporter [Streptomyces sp. NPDC046805]|uniref:MFS transporter n=1 Tax=Streptomyces sp. NPDC046805 TaxID=3155134 RepID=UPI0033CF4554